MLSPVIVEVLGWVVWNLLLFIGLSKVVSFFMNRKEETALRNQINRKRDLLSQNVRSLEAKLLVDGCLLTDSRKTILNLPVLDLIAALQKKQYTAVEVLQAYQAKSLEVTKDTNCVTEFITEAEEWAKALDAADKIKGPLHGLPFSVKENAAVKGYDSSKGLARHLFQPAEADAVMVEALKSLGAIPFCKTNLPQTMLSYGCSNPVFGRTDNPFVKNRVPGGSSGGEAALIALGGSPFGIGSDIGGSLRVPAHFSGISTLKCTLNRLSYKNYKGSVIGVVGLSAVPGIMSKDVKVLTLLHKLLLKDSYLAKFDHNVCPVPWSEKKFNIERKLRIGYYESDDYFPATPGCRRAVLEAKCALEAQGHELVPITLPCSLGKAMEGFLSILHADQCKQFLAILKNETVDPVLVVTVLGASLPHFLRPVAAAILSPFSKVLSGLLKATGGARTRYSHQLWQALQEQNQLLEEFVNYFRTQKLDLCLGPVFAGPAPLASDIGRLFAAGSYSAVYNYLSMPAGVVSVTHENDEDQEKLAQYPRTDLVYKLMAKTMKGAQGVPIGVQLIGQPWEEELVLAGMNALEDALQKSA